MRKFLVEAYLSHDGYEYLPEAIARVECSAAELTSQGQYVQHLRTIFVPEDETCFHLFEGVSVAAVAEVGRRAELGFNRISEAVGPDLDDHRIHGTSSRATEGGAF